MTRVAIIVQRCHESVVGGSESLAWQFATLLKDKYEVDLLTTTAVDAAYWSNVLPAGTEIRDGINIRRFHVDIGYSPFRTDLFTRLLQDFKRFNLGGQRDGQSRHYPWSVPLQEELVRRIGPHSVALTRYVRDHWSTYRAVFVVTYLYPPAYFSLLEIPKGHALFVPTLHNEEPAYLSIYKHAARRAHSVLWLTEAERRLGTNLWGELPGRVVGMAIENGLREPAHSETPYLLYCGRIDPNKGCGEMFDYFTRFKTEHPSPLRLVLTGKDDIPIPDHPDIDFRGFVSEEEKFKLMAGARLYIMPSSRESFSIVALEAMAQGTPVLANAASAVLADHIAESHGGSVFADYESFSIGLNEFLTNEARRRQAGQHGREYVTARYVPDRIREALIEIVESTPAPSQVIHGSYSTESAVQPIIPPDSGNGRVLVDKITLEDLSKSPPLPLPAGWSEDALRQMLSSVKVEDAPPDELKTYVDADFKRFVYTLGLVPEKTGQAILELGANPYFTTTLLHKFREANLHLANFFDGSYVDGKQEVTIQSTGEVIEYAYKQFNIEKDVFPYPDDFFDVVLFCEILEHLLADPVHALTQIRRVLKPGGDLILTTPNVARLDNIRKIISGENIYDPYSGYGPYGRHNREYTQEDLFNLLTTNGFTVRTMFTADVHPGHTSSTVALSAIAHLVRNRPADLGQYIFARCNLAQESKSIAEHRPAWLYRSLTESR